AWPLRIRGEDRALYHAASVAASNFVVGLMAFAAELWGEAGIPPDKAVPALLPLVEGSVRNLASAGLPGALTGPVARGDAGTVRAHLAALAGNPEWVAVYRAVSSVLIGVARAQGTMSEAQLTRLRDVLGEPGAAESAPEERNRADDGPANPGD